MMNGNGHTNGHAPRGVGGVPRCDDPHRVRSDVRVIVQAVTKGWVKEPAKIQRMVERLESVVETCEDPRAAVAAFDGLMRVVALGQKVAEFDTVQERLEAGKATEIVGYEVAIPRVRD